MSTLVTPMQALQHRIAGLYQGIQALKSTCRVVRNGINERETLVRQLQALYRSSKPLLLEAKRRTPPAGLLAKVQQLEASLDRLTERFVALKCAITQVEENPTAAQLVQLRSPAPGFAQSLRSP